MRHFLPALFVFVSVFTAPSFAANPAGPLATWQQALEQLANGNGPAGRELLEAAIKKDGPSEQANLLLAWLWQREGNTKAALATLAQIPDSRLAKNFAEEIKSAPPQPPATAEQKLLATLEAAMVAMVNAERAKHGLKALETDEKMTAVARAHSAEMRDKDYFSHQSPTKGLRDPMDRYVKVLGATPHVLAENIYKSGGAPRTLREADIREGHQALMESTGHRKNILLDDVTRIGMGLALNPRGDVWVTQVFARP